jgi:hypothetical protein
MLSDEVEPVVGGLDWIEDNVKGCKYVSRGEAWRSLVGCGRNVVG